MNSQKQGRVVYFKIKLFNRKNSKLRRNCVVKGAKLTLRLLFCHRSDYPPCQSKNQQHNNPKSILMKFHFQELNRSEEGSESLKVEGQ